MVFVADDLAAWLTALLAEGARRRLATVVLGSDQDRALRSACWAAVRSTAQEICPHSEAQAQHVALVISQVFGGPVASPQPTAPVTVLDALRAGIASQLAVLDEASLTGTARSSADVLGVPGSVMADKLTAHLLREIKARGARGGSLFALASQLNHDETHVQGQQVAELVGNLAAQGQQVAELVGHLAEAGSTERVGRWQVPTLPMLTGREVPRSDLIVALLEMVTAQSAGDRATIGLHGTGGFGKTTLARMLVHEPALQVRFPDGIVWVALGEAATGSSLATRINGVRAQLTGIMPLFSDPHQAGADLGRIWADRRMLLVVDDVWGFSQLEPFLYGGDNVVRLAISRQRSALPPDIRALRVDAMQEAEARLLLLGGVAGAPPALVKDILELTGRWPVLLALVNGVLRTAIQAGRPVVDALAEIHAALADAGPTVLDIDDPHRRTTAVAATLAASLARLPADRRDRYFELAAFGEVEVPRTVLEQYWWYTGGMTPFQTQLFCQQLADQSLVISFQEDHPEPRLRLHNVIQAYLQHAVADALPHLHRQLLDAHRPILAVEEGYTAWWRLPPDRTYLWAWIAAHLRDAGLTDELRHMLHHPAFLLGKLEHGGAAALESDLALGGDPASTALERVVSQNAHLLAPSGPPGSLAATLLSRMATAKELRGVAKRLEATTIPPYLRTICLPPDLQHPALRRTLAGQAEGVMALTVAPDGTWLASGGSDGTVRIWDPVTGAAGHVLTGHSGGVAALAVAPDGSWLASGGNDAAVRIWDLADGTERRCITGHVATVRALVAAADGSWLASIDGAGNAHIWDSSNGRLRRVIRCRHFPFEALVMPRSGFWLAMITYEFDVVFWFPATDEVKRTVHVLDFIRSAAAAPDGSWLATGGHDGAIVIRNLFEDRDYRFDAFWGHNGGITSVASAPDGVWLATGGNDGAVSIWDSTTGTLRLDLVGHAGQVTGMAVAPDGTWLATAGEDATIRIWDPAHVAKRARTNFVAGNAYAMAVAKDGTVLATASDNGKLQIWDTATGSMRHVRDKGPGNRLTIGSLAFSADGALLAAGGWGAVMRVWNTRTGRSRRPFTGPLRQVDAVAIAPDASWAAAVGGGGQAYIWSLRTRKEMHCLDAMDAVASVAQAPYIAWQEGGSPYRDINPSSRQFTALAAAPDGSWLAAAGGTGTVLIWDVRTGALVHSLAAHTSVVWALAVAPDGTWLATVSQDGTARIWDTATGNQRHVLSGHHGPLGSLAVAPDGTWLATASQDGTARIWDTATGDQRHVLIGHEGPVTAVAISPEGSWLATAGVDGTLRVWDATTGLAITSMWMGHLLASIGTFRNGVAVSGIKGPYILKLVTDR